MKRKAHGAQETRHNVVLGKYPSTHATQRFVRAGIYSGRSVTAPFDAELTVRAYLASTPRV